jgi:hypothetical protein
MQRMSNQESTLRKISECLDRSRENETAGEVEPDGLSREVKTARLLSVFPGILQYTTIIHSPDGMKPIRKLDENIFIYG